MYYYLQSHSCSPSLYSPGLLLMSRSSFFNLDTTDALGWKILCCRGCPVHCGIFISISGLYPLGASTILTLLPQVVSTKNVARHLQIFLGGSKCPRLRPQALNSLRSFFFPLQTACFFLLPGIALLSFLPCTGSSSFILCPNASSTKRPSPTTPSSCGFLSPSFAYSCVTFITMRCYFIDLLIEFSLSSLLDVGSMVAGSMSALIADLLLVPSMGLDIEQTLGHYVFWMNKEASSHGGPAAHSLWEAYLLDCEGAYDIFCQGLCFNQGDFNVSVDLRVIWPVSHTFHLWPSERQRQNKDNDA